MRSISRLLKNLKREEQKKLIKKRRREKPARIPTEFASQAGNFFFEEEIMCMMCEIRRICRKKIPPMAPSFGKKYPL